MNAAQACVVVFDSGMGGLTVARAVRRELPDISLVYAADTAAFPYGDWDEARLVERIVAVVGRLIERIRPHAVVLACNTASTLALSALRERFHTPFVGTVPAIKPAARQTGTGVIGVLATPGTVRREYTQALIDTYAYHCRVLLHGAPRLAEMAEAKLKGTAVDRKALQDEIAPVFRRRGGRPTDTVVLGCTHYPLLLDDLAEAAPWPVTFIDPAPAIARRLRHVIAAIDEPPPGIDGERLNGTALFTSRRGISEGHLAAYAREGLMRHVIEDVPI